MNSRVFSYYIMKAFFGRKMQYLKALPVKKRCFVFEVKIHQPMPLQRVATVAEGIGAVEGQKLTIRIAAYWTLNGVA